MPRAPLFATIATMVLALLLLPAPVVSASESNGASDAASESDGAIELGATNRFVIHGPGLVRVHLPVAATMSGVLDDENPSTTLDNPDVDTDGNGRVLAVQFTSADAGNNARFMAGRLGFCDEPGCTPRATEDFLLTPIPPNSSFDNTTITIPAGTYDVHAVTDEAPGEITMRLDGPVGATQIDIAPDPAAPIALQHHELAVHTSVGDGLAHWAGTTLDVPPSPSPRGSILFIAVLQEGRGWVVGEAGSCVYPGGPPDGVPPEVLYGPHCTGQSQSSADYGQRLDTFAVAFTPSFTVQASGGTYGVGAWNDTVAAEMTSAQVLAFTLGL